MSTSAQNTIKLWSERIYNTVMTGGLAVAGWFLLQVWDGMNENRASIQKIHTKHATYDATVFTKNDWDIAKVVNDVHHREYEKRLMMAEMNNNQIRTDLGDIKHILQKFLDERYFPEQRK